MKTTHKSILYLQPPKFAGGLKSLLLKYLRAANIPIAKVRFHSFTQDCTYWRTKTIMECRPEKKDEVLNKIRAAKPDLIVINDKASLFYITGKYMSLALCRGSIIMWEGIPCIVLDDVKKTKSMRTYNWIFISDCKKLHRWIYDTQKQEPRFEYTVCRSNKDLDTMVEWAENSIAIAADIETAYVDISCSGYTMWTKDNKIHTFVVPFIDPSKPNCCYWPTEELEIEAWEAIRKVHDTDAVKCFQNGAYDCAYFIRYGIPVRNYVADTLHLFRAIWVEAPKTLAFISSICLDYYRYWKDEGKGLEDAKEDTKGSRMPQTAEGVEGYWLYNALDCHFTMLNLRFLTRVLTVSKQLEWALDNYTMEFALQMGPLLKMSMQGTHVNDSIRQIKATEWREQSDAARIDLMQMVGMRDFNPNSYKQVQDLIYDDLQATPVAKGKKARATGEKELALIATEHPLLERVIQCIWDTKKPANNASKYGDMRLLNGRFMYQIGVSTTPTMRCNSKKMQFWLGGNIQSIPKPARVFFEADPGCVLVDADYAQSDAYFTAFTSGDEKYIDVIAGERDSHCVHAAHFFQKDYDEIMEGHAVEADWVDHPTQGVRQITKRIVYGANYMMAARTLFMQMGKTSVVAAAHALGYADAHTWTHKKLIYLCDKFLESYFVLYPALQEWLDSEIELAKQKGNMATCCGGFTRMFFGDLSDSKVQREFAAFFGQAGTAGNINQALFDMYYGQDGKGDANTLTNKGVILMFQVHDSVIFQVPKDRLDLIPETLQVMQRQCNMRGRDFVVPVDAKVGLGWGKRMINYNENVTLNDIQTYDNKWKQKFFDEANAQVSTRNVN